MGIVRGDLGAGYYLLEIYGIDVLEIHHISEFTQRRKLSDAPIWLFFEDLEPKDFWHQYRYVEPQDEAAE